MHVASSMSVANLTILSVSWRSAHYLEPLLENLRAKAAAPAELAVLVVDNTGGADADLARLHGHAGDVEVVPFSPDETNGSRAHAKALDFALPRIRTPYVVIVDPDIHVFLAGWDDVCRRALQAHDAIAIGAPYPSWKVGKYHDFPSPPFCFVDTAAVRALGASFTPDVTTSVAAARAFAFRQIGRAGGLLTRRRYEQSALVRSYATAMEHTLGVFGPDTGWRVAQACRAAGKKAIVFDAVRATDAPPPDLNAERGLATLATLAAEFELYTYEGKPALTHKYGSGAPPWRTRRGADERLWRSCIAEVERMSATAKE
jgi:hypothetical protein